MFHLLITAVQAAIAQAMPGAIVRGAAALEAARERAQFADEVYVVPEAESAGESLVVNAHRQLITSRIAVAFWARVTNDRHAESGLAELAVRREQIQLALFGLNLPGDFQPLLFVSGRLLQASPQALLWADSYESKVIRSAPHA